MIRFILIVILTAISGRAVAQTKYTVSGHAKDKKTGESLIGASIQVKELPGTGVTANSYGYFSLTLAGGNYTLIISAVGYQEQTIRLSLSANTRIDLSLSSTTKQLEEVVVTSTKTNKVAQTFMGVEKLSMEEINKIPVILGERDPLKTIQLLPGVKNASEGTAGFYVRGGGADQNLILLDEATVYNAAHFLGFFSVFNADALKDVTLYKGNMPAEFGGRLSSVLDIKMKEGNNQQFAADGGIGLIASRLSIQGPIVKDKGSFIVSGRRTYVDVFLGLSGSETLKNSSLYFYDVNLKANYTLDDKNKIFVSGYFGKDRLKVSDFFDNDWGNATATVRWNHIFSNKLFSNTSLIYSNYNYQFADNLLGGNKQSISSRIQDYNLKQDFQFWTANNNTIKFGLNAIYHTINPGTLTSEAGVRASDLKLKRYGLENAAYASHEFKIRNRLTINYGLRASHFTVLGPGDFYDFVPGTSNNKLDTISYGSGEVIKTYFNLEPRVAINYRIDNESAVKAAYGRTTQNLHLISSLTIASPTDLWIPSSLVVKPEICDQYSIGYFRNINNNGYEFSAELYYKDLQNQIDYKDGARLEFNSSVETELLIGKGRAYGAELLIKKKKGRLNGWIGYTLSRTERRFPEINNGDYYPTRQDRTHDITIVGMYEFNQKWSFSANWVYYTGHAVTFPSGKYEINGNIVPYYTERNGYRMPGYHRLDLGATLQGRKTKKFESSWTFSLYNAYGRENPFMMVFQKNNADPTKTEVLQVSPFKWVPSVTYNFKF